MHMQDTSKNGTFFPKPADLIRLINGDPEKADQELKDRAVLAWNEIEYMLGRRGASRPFKPECPEAYAALRSTGTWQDLCMIEMSQLPKKRAQFIESFLSISRTESENLPALPGMEDVKQSRICDTSHRITNASKVS